MWSKLMVKRITAILVIASLLLFVCGASLVLSKEDKDIKDFHPEQVLVKFVPGTPTFIKKEIHRKLGGVVIDEISQLEVEIVKVPPGKVEAQAPPPWKMLLIMLGIKG